MEHINNAIDWVSIKLNAPCLVLLFLNVDAWMKGLALASVISTLVYNGIRIYKELKTKKKI